MPFLIVGRAFKVTHLPAYGVSQFSQITAAAEAVTASHIFLAEAHAVK